MAGYYDDDPYGINPAPPPVLPSTKPAREDGAVWNDYNKRWEYGYQEDGYPDVNFASGAVFPTAPQGGPPAHPPLAPSSGETPTQSLSSFAGLGGSSTADWPAFAPPVFQAPEPFSYPDFQAPSLADARNEPGFEFAMDQGRKALETSAAAKGTLRTGGTLKDLFAWGNKFGEQNYGNVYNRAANTYSLNRGNAFDNYGLNFGVSKDKFDRDYRGSFDTFSFGQRNRELDFARDLDEYLAQLDVQKTIFNAGLD